MKHLGTKLLETARLLLRPFVREDWAAMYRNWASDPEVTKFLTWKPHASQEITQLVLASWVNSYARPDYYQWAIVPKALGEPIGSISVVGYEGHDNRIPQVGYCIGKPWWHQGYTSEALGRIIDFLIGEAGAATVVARHDPRNPNSGGVMRKCGMVYEGTLHQADRNNQGVCDACVYAITAADWRLKRREGLPEGQA